MSDLEPINCWIYRSSRQHEMYLYLCEEDAFDDIPEALMNRFGTPSLVMELELHQDRKLSRVEVADVMNSLRNSGFFLQMPPQIHAELYDAEH